MSRRDLTEYKAKRTFTATPEPGPALAANNSGPLLFVVQQHAARNLHYDFRLECDGVLLSWAVPKGPSLNRNDKRFAVQTEDHPYEYASFEGIIPAKQYGAGEVIVWDCGVFSPDEGGLSFHDREEAQRRMRTELAAGKLSIQLRGEKLKGSFAMVKMKEPKQWLLIKHRDRFEGAIDVTGRNRSVLSGIAVEEMKVLPVKRMAASALVPAGETRPMPDKLAPMLAESSEAAFNRAEWLWEPKLDGYRVIAFVGEDGVKLRSRNGLDLSRDFPALATELAQQAGGGMILDGEIVAFDTDGRPSFAKLQDRAQMKKVHDLVAADRSTPVVFFCFDLLYFAGVDLRGAPYRDRRRYLSQCLLPSPLVQLVHAAPDGVELQQVAIAMGFEGVIGKRLDSRYESGRRSQSWLKVKPTQTADFVVGGYMTGKGSRASLGSIIVGYWDKGKLQYASHVGSGFDERTLPLVKARLEALKTKACPFVEEPELNGPTTWVEPKAVVEVSYFSWTEEGRLRAPVFLRMRDDLDAKKVRRSAGLPRADGGPVQLDSRLHGNDMLDSRRHGNDMLDSRLHGNDMLDSRRHGNDIGEVLAQLANKKAALTLAVGPHRIKLTNLERVYWPENVALKQRALTKRDLLRYLAQVSPYMLPHLAERPLTMIRMPDGIRGQRFFQKHWDQARPEFVESVTVFSGHKEEEHEYLLCNNLPTLLWLAQSGTLEYHVWHSRAQPGPDTPIDSIDYATSLESLETSILNYPDFVLFDLDPYIYSGEEAPGTEPELNTTAFEKGKEVAFWLRELLASMSLEAIVKTSGKTGLHIFVPINRTIDFDAVRHVSELVGRHLMRLHPRDITLDWSVPKRTGKIFMDYNMNVRGKTLNVAYSPRGEPGGPVSMPLTWEELANAHPLHFRLDNAAERLAATGDRWSDVLERKQDLRAALGRG